MNSVLVVLVFTLPLLCGQETLHKSPGPSSGKPMQAEHRQKMMQMHEQVRGPGIGGRPQAHPSQKVH